MMNYKTKQTAVIQRQRTESSLSVASGMSQLSAVAEHSPYCFFNENADGVNDNATRRDLDEDQNKDFNRVMFNLEQDQSQHIRITPLCDCLPLLDGNLRDTDGLQGSRTSGRNVLPFQCQCQVNNQCCQLNNVGSTCVSASERHPAPKTMQCHSGSRYLVPHISHHTCGSMHAISNPYIPDISLNDRKNCYITAIPDPVTDESVLSQRQSNDQMYKDGIQTNQEGSVSASEYSTVKFPKKGVKTKRCCLTRWKKRMLNCYGPGFIILCLLNIILIMSNVVGLPFLYVSRQLKYSNSVTERQSIQSHGCEHFKNLLDVPFADNTSKFCLKPLTELIQIISKYAHDMKENITAASVEKSRLIENVPEKQLGPAHIQLKAVNWTRYGSNSVVLWEHLSTNYPGIILTNDKVSVRVNTSGYYFIYIRVHYKKPKFIAESLQLSIGNAISKKDHPSDLDLDSIRQRCFPTNASEDIDQFINMESLHYFKANDTIYIKLHNKTFFQANNTLFGMFYI